METIDRLADWVHGETWPDVTILLDAPVEVGMARAGSRGQPDRIEREQHDFFERVRACYLELASREGDRFVIVDTARPLSDVADDVRLLARSIIDRFYINKAI